MVAVAHFPPVANRRLVVVRSPCAVRPRAAPVPSATFRRRRTVAAGAGAALLLSLSLAVPSILGALGRGPAPGPRRPGPAGTVYVVQPGDTFWDIARMRRPDADPRPEVARLVAAHGHPVLVAGERISLPGGA